ncbi:MAG TPA: YafY family protein [Polyangia bacterium]|nr:YafY family protein [Polyangia bacterium]
MRRADRLFQIVQRLRRHSRGSVVTAAELARDLEVSERTVYRDVADLIASGVPIEAEAGVGYRLPRGTYDLPPLMFDEDEIEALVLGARVVKGWGDPALAAAAENALSKIEAILPAQLKDRVADATLFALNLRREHRDVGAALGTVRGAIRAERKIELDYVDRTAQSTTRIVWPLGLFYWGAVWTVGGWCELRDGFRNFRLDRIARLKVTEARYPRTPGRTLGDLFVYYRSLPASGDGEG